MAKIKKTIKESSKAKTSPFKDYWNRNNYLILFFGVLSIFVGFYLMGQGNWDSSVSLSVSPVVLIIAYVVIIPLSIFFNKFKKNENKQNVPS